MSVIEGGERVEHGALIGMCREKVHGILSGYGFIHQHVCVRTPCVSMNSTEGFVHWPQEG